MASDKVGRLRKLDIGICSYRNPEKLERCLRSIEAMSVTDWHCLIVHNTSGDEEGIEAKKVALAAHMRNARFAIEIFNPNARYAGAVNWIAQNASTPYFAYLDNDTEILTPGWDEKLCAVMDQDEQIGQVFPGAGHYGFFNGQYHECLWNAGYAWVMRREVCDLLGFSNGLMDTSLGHHEEVDLMVRLRLAGLRIACAPDVQIAHHETATRSRDSQKRIHAGVVRFMNKWERYFVGDSVKHPNPDPDSGEGYAPAFIRYTDWNVNALYLERWALSQFPNLNAEPETIQTSAGPMDLIKILKPAGCYKGRAI